MPMIGIKISGGKNITVNSCNYNGPGTGLLVEKTDGLTVRNFKSVGATVHVQLDDVLNAHLSGINAENSPSKIIETLKSDIQIKNKEGFIQKVMKFWRHTQPLKTSNDAMDLWEKVKHLL